ncbi:MAG: molybdopterin-containing oxidoreductase family protein [Deferrisomatales bacterium]
MTELSRRQFLAVGATGAAGLAFENKARVLRAPEKPWNEGTGRALRKFLDPIPTACVGCACHCALVAYRDGDRVSQVAPNPRALSGGKLCARAYQGLEALYDPERVLRPLRRAGARGEGRWEPVSWEEAADQVSRALAQSPTGACVDSGRPDPLAGELLPRLGVQHRVTHDASRRWASLASQRAVYGLPLGVPDLRRPRTVLLAGARPLDEGPHFAALARELTRARAAGAAIVSVSPFAGATGSLASEWIPCRPGTEAVVLLGIARELLARRSFDPTVFGRFVQGTAEELQAALAPYTAEEVEAVAGVPERLLSRATERLAGVGPALCLADGSGRPEAGSLEAACALVNALGGDPEEAGLRLARSPGWLPEAEPTSTREGVVKGILDGTQRVPVYLAYRSNPVYWSPQSRAVAEAFQDEGRIGLLVAMDTHLTETAQLADLVLPAATDLEMWNLLGGYTPEGKVYAVLQQPAQRRPPEPVLLRSPDVPLERLFDGPGTGPLGEALQLGDFLLQVAGRRGTELPYSDCGAYVREQAERAGLLEARGDYGGLLRDGYWEGPASYPRAADVGFPTPTGLLQVADALSRRGAPEGEPLGGNAFGLAVLSYPELGSGYANTRWGREVRYRNPVYLQAERARSLGLRAGDRVLLATSAGQAVGRVLPVQGIHPDAVAVAEDFGHWAGGVAATARNEATGDKRQPLLVSRKNLLTNPLGVSRQGTAPGEIPWWHAHGAGLSVAELSPFALDEHGAQVRQGVRVTIRRA